MNNYAITLMYINIKLHSNCFSSWFLYSYNSKHMYNKESSNNTHYFELSLLIECDNLYCVPEAKLPFEMWTWHWFLFLQHLFYLSGQHCNALSFPSPTLSHDTPVWNAVKALCIQINWGEAGAVAQQARPPPAAPAYPLGTDSSPGCFASDADPSQGLLQGTESLETSRLHGRNWVLA